nr:putative HAD hydrolase, subfamily IA, pyrimidine 5-nucleotidase [Tanacetum cinerariifolium]
MTINPLVYQLPAKSPIVCKPFGNAFQEAFKMSEINPYKIGVASNGANRMVRHSVKKGWTMLQIAPQ